MPLLKYKCTSCDNVFEELVPLGTLTVECPQCNSTDTVRYYRGKCSFGQLGGSSSGCTGGDCSKCSGCTSK